MQGAPVSKAAIMDLKLFLETPQTFNKDSGKWDITAGLPHPRVRMDKPKPKPSIIVGPAVARCACFGAGWEGGCSALIATNSLW